MAETVTAFLIKVMGKRVNWAERRQGEEDILQAQEQSSCGRRAAMSLKKKSIKVYSW